MVGLAVPFDPSPCVGGVGLLCKRIFAAGWWVCTFAGDYGNITSQDVMRIVAVQRQKLGLDCFCENQLCYITRNEFTSQRNKTPLEIKRTSQRS